MSRRTSTLTQRIVWALTGSVTIFVAVLGVFSYFTFDQMEDDLVNDILTTETERIIPDIAAGDGFLSKNSMRELGGPMRAWLYTEDEPHPDIPEALVGLADGLHLLEPGLETWHVVVTGVPQGRLVVLEDATENETRVHNFGLIILGVGAICLALAYTLSRRVAGVVVGPMLELTDKLATWAPGAPDIAVTRDDEAGRLIEAFNRVQNQVDESIAREREFTANLSHEIRTPLAAIRSDSELMLLSEPLSDYHDTRLQRIVNNVDSVVASLESARSMARDQPRAPESVDLSICMDDAWHGLEAYADAAGLSLSNQIATGHIQLVDRYALQTVLRNLLRNAIEHAGPATLTVTLADGGGIALRDNGKGIHAEDLPFVFRRYYSGRLHDAPGDNEIDASRGLGLAIAKRVCDMQGWDLSVESECDGPLRGTQFVLRFAAIS